ncbi:hypothetical protein [Streptomyces sp. NPDC050600]|uniref:hypothetical protein n=1 Tax=Streptomyces sp. NPDC050600 TaxID=3157213 RepID=UPI0034141860
MLPKLHTTRSRQYLENRLNITPGTEAGKLSTEHVAAIAAYEAADTRAFDDTTHLLRLMDLLPLPGEADGEGPTFWMSLSRVGGKNGAAFLPVNARGNVLEALNGNGEPLALRWLYVLGKMAEAERTAMADLIGQALVKRMNLHTARDPYLGRLWLDDVEATSWRITARSVDDPDFRDDEERAQQFHHAWRNA